MAKTVSNTNENLEYLLKFEKKFPSFRFNEI